VEQNIRYLTHYSGLRGDGDDIIGSVVVLVHDSQNVYHGVEYPSLIFTSDDNMADDLESDKESVIL